MKTLIRSLQNRSFTTTTTNNWPPACLQQSEIWKQRMKELNKDRKLKAKSELLLEIAEKYNFEYLPRPFMLEYSLYKRRNGDIETSILYYYVSWLRTLQDIALVKNLETKTTLFDETVLSYLQFGQKHRFSSSLSSFHSNLTNELLSKAFEVIQSANELHTSHPLHLFIDTPSAAWKSPFAKGSLKPKSILLADISKISEQDYILKPINETVSFIHPSKWAPIRSEILSTLYDVHTSNNHNNNELDEFGSYRQLNIKNNKDKNPKNINRPRTIVSDLYSPLLNKGEIIQSKLFAKKDAATDMCDPVRMSPMILSSFESLFKVLEQYKNKTSSTTNNNPLLSSTCTKITSELIKFKEATAIQSQVSTIRSLTHIITTSFRNYSDVFKPLIEPIVDTMIVIVIHSNQIGVNSPIISLLSTISNIFNNDDQISSSLSKHFNELSSQWKNAMSSKTTIKTELYLTLEALLHIAPGFYGLQPHAQSIFQFIIHSLSIAVSDTSSTATTTIQNLFRTLPSFINAFHSSISLDWIHILELKRNDHDHDHDQEDDDPTIITKTAGDAVAKPDYSTPPDFATFFVSAASSTPADALLPTSSAHHESPITSGMKQKSVKKQVARVGTTPESSSTPLKHFPINITLLEICYQVLERKDYGKEAFLSSASTVLTLLKYIPSKTCLIDQLIYNYYPHYVSTQSEERKPTPPKVLLFSLLSCSSRFDSPMSWLLSLSVLPIVALSRAVLSMIPRHILTTPSPSLCSFDPSCMKLIGSSKNGSSSTDPESPASMITYPTSSQSSSGASLIFDPIFGTLHDLCSSSNPYIRIIAFQAVAFWLDSVSNLLSEKGADSAVDAAKLQLEFNLLFDIAWTHSDDPTSSIAYQSQKIFNTLITLCQGSTTSTSADFFEQLTGRLLTLPWDKKAKYPALIRLLPIVGASTLLRLDGQLMNSLTDANVTRTVGTATISIDLLKAILASYESESRALGGDVDVVTRVLELWLPQLSSSLFTDSKIIVTTTLSQMNTKAVIEAHADNFEWLLAVFKRTNLVAKGLAAATPPSNHYEAHPLVQALADRYGPSMDITCRCRAMVGLFKVARPIGLVNCLNLHRINDDQSPQGVTMDSGSILAAALCSPSEVLRLDAWDILVCQRKSSEPVSEFEFALIYQWLPLNLKTSHPSSRSRWKGTFKQLFLRLRDSTSKWIAQKEKQARRAAKGQQQFELEEGTVSHLADYPQRVEDLFLWLTKTALSFLYPGAPFQRVALALSLYCQLLEYCYSPPQPHFPRWNEFVTSAANTTTFIYELADTWNTHRQSATDVLKRLPTPLVSLETVNESMTKLLAWAMRLIHSARLAETDAGARFLSVFCSKYVVSLGWTVRVCYAVDETKKLKIGTGFDVSPSGGSAIGFISELLDLLTVHIENAETKVITAAEGSPIHGVILSLRYCLLTIDFQRLNQEQTLAWKPVLARTVELASRAGGFAVQAMLARSAEGGKAETLNPANDVVPPDIATDELENEIGQGWVAQGEQLVIVCCWLTASEMGQLLGQLVQRVPLPYSNKSTEPSKHQSKKKSGGGGGERAPQFDRALLSPTQIQQIGDTLVSTLFALRHNGAVDLCYHGLMWTCERIYKSENSELVALPSRWIGQCFDTILSKNFSITRRSAGLPYAMTAVLRNEPVNSRWLLHQTLERLLEISSNENLPAISRVHGMNCLRSLFKESILSNDVLAHGGAAFILVIRASLSPHWIIRNAGNLLFSNLIPRCIHGRINSDEFSVHNSITARACFVRCRGLHGEILSQFKSMELTATPEKVQVKENLLQILFLLAKLLPSPIDTPDDPNALFWFIPYVSACAKLPQYYIRVMAARAIFPLVPQSEFETFTLSLINNGLKLGLHQNEIHGSLLQIYRLVDGNFATIHTRSTLEAASSAFITALTPHIHPIIERRVPFVAVALIELCEMMWERSENYMKSSTSGVWAGFVDTVSAACETIIEKHVDRIAEDGSGIGSVILRSRAARLYFSGKIKSPKHSLLRTLLSDPEYELRANVLAIIPRALLSSSVDLLRDCRELLLSECVDEALEQVVAVFTEKESGVLDDSVWSTKELIRAGLARVNSLLASSTRPELIAQATILGGQLIGKWLQNYSSEESDEADAEIVGWAEIVYESSRPHGPGQAVAEGIKRSGLLSTIEVKKKASFLCWAALRRLLEDEDRAIRYAASLVASAQVMDQELLVLDQYVSELCLRRMYQVWGAKPVFLSYLICLLGLDEQAYDDSWLDLQQDGQAPKSALFGVEDDNPFAEPLVAAQLASVYLRRLREEGKIPIGLLTSLQQIVVRRLEKAVKYIQVGRKEGGGGGGAEIASISNNARVFLHVSKLLLAASALTNDFTSSESYQKITNQLREVQRLHPFLKTLLTVNDKMIDDTDDDKILSSSTWLLHLNK